MNFIFILLFLVALGHKYWRKHRTDLVIRLIANAFTPKNTSNNDGLSQATRTASKSILMKYKYKGVTYEMVLPVRSRPLGWSVCTATMYDGSEKDVTESVAERAGPMKDFYGAKLRAQQVYRGANKLVFANESGSKTYLTIE